MLRRAEAERQRRYAIAAEAMANAAGAALAAARAARRARRRAVAASRAAKRRRAEGEAAGRERQRQFSEAALQRLQRARVPPFLCECGRALLVGARALAEPEAEALLNMLEDKSRLWVAARVVQHLLALGPGHTHRRAGAIAWMEVAARELAEERQHVAARSADASASRVQRQRQQREQRQWEEEKEKETTREEKEEERKKQNEWGLQKQQQQQQQQRGQEYDEYTQEVEDNSPTAAYADSWDSPAAAAGAGNNKDW